MAICYIHILNLVLQNSIKILSTVYIFLITCNFASFSTFVKDSMLLMKLLSAYFHSAPTTRLYNNRLVQMIYNHKEELTILLNLFWEIILCLMQSCSIEQKVLIKIYMILNLISYKNYFILCSLKQSS